MKYSAHLQEGIINLFSSKLRSILALLGILVGTASVVAMISGGELATREALKQFETLGTDLLAVTLSEYSTDDAPSRPQNNLSLQDGENVFRADQNIVEAAPYTNIYSTNQYNGQELNAEVLGVTDSFARLIHLSLLQGRFISSLDKYAAFCLVGNHVYQLMKKISYQDPIGQQIQIGQTIFTVIGVAGPWPENSFVYASMDNAILIPLLTSTTLSKNVAINNIILRLAPHADIDLVNKHIAQYFKNIGKDKRLFFRSAKELIAKMGKQNQILTVFLGLIGGVSLLVGGIGVMNIMLVSVVERRREIGIRLAVGATRADIRSLFLLEAIMLAFVGGIGGVLIGMLIAYMIAVFWHWQFTLFLLPPLIGFSVSVAVGIFFGFYPAYQASQLDPIEALRSE